MPNTEHKIILHGLLMSTKILAADNGHNADEVLNMPVVQ